MARSIGLRIRPWYGFWIWLERWGFGRYRWLRRRLGGHWEQYRMPLCPEPDPWLRLKPKCCSRVLPDTSMADQIMGELRCEEWPVRGP